MADKQGKMERALKLDDEKYRNDMLKRRKALTKEPKVGVYGNPLYKEHLGYTYAFDYCDYPVSITFDGKTYYYPKTIANELQRKLDRAAYANTPKNINESIVI